MNNLFPKLRSATRQASQSASSVRSQFVRFASVSSASPTTNTATNASRARPFIYVLGLMPIVCLGLGGWQVGRLRWKLDMIDQFEAKLNKDTVRLPARIE